jgi:hypothetical protein
VSWLERGVEAAGPDAPNHIRAQGLLGLGTLLISTDRHAESVPMLEEAGALYRQLDEEGADRSVLLYGYSAALINLSSEMESLGDYDESKRLNEAALEVSKRLGDPAGLAVSLGNLAEAAGRAGDIEGARERFADAIAASRALRSPQRLVEQYWQVAFFELSGGHPERARTAFQQAQAQAEDGGMDDYAVSGRAFLAFCEAELGDDQAGERFTTDAQRMFENPNLRVFTFARQNMLVFRAALDARQGNLAKAATALGALAAIEDTGATLNWTLEGRRAQVLELVEAGLDRAELAAAMEAGRRLGLDDVIALITSD